MTDPVYVYASAMHGVHWAATLTAAGAVLAVVVAAAALVVSIRANALASASAKAAKKSAEAAEATNRRDADRRFDEMAPGLNATAEWDDFPLKSVEKPDSLLVTVRNGSNRDYTVRGMLRSRGSSGPGKEISFMLSALGTKTINMGGSYLGRASGPVVPQYDRLFLVLETTDGIGSWERAFELPLYGGIVDVRGYPVRRQVAMTAIPYDTPCLPSDTPSRSCSFPLSGPPGPWFRAASALDPVPEG